MYAADWSHILISINPMYASARIACCDRFLFSWAARLTPVFYPHRRINLGDLRRGNERYKGAKKLLPEEPYPQIQEAFRPVHEMDKSTLRGKRVALCGRRNA